MKKVGLILASRQIFAEEGMEKENWFPNNLVNILLLGPGVGGGGGGCLTNWEVAYC